MKFEIKRRANQFGVEQELSALELLGMLEDADSSSIWEVSEVEE